MGNTGNNDDDVIDLLEIFFELKKRWWWLLIALVIGFGSAGAYSKLIMVPQYTSTAMVYVLSKETTLTSLADLQIGSQLTKDYSVIVTSRPVLQEVLTNLGLTNMTYRDLRAKLKIDNPSDTRIMRLTITDPDPYLAKSLVDEVANVSSELIAQIMEMTPPKVIEDGEVATVKSSPSVKKNAVMGGMAGLVLAGGIIVLMTIMNDTIKTEDDIEKYLGISILASVPDWNNTKAAKKQAYANSYKNSRKKK